ncbi:MAG TPA: PaaI family thioesterase [Blastocatellia bacterium]|nr:PaaI family thioesterase [Blastocatellia bacterium]
MTRFHDSFDAMLKGEVEHPPAAKLIGMRLVSYDKSGASQFEMDADERHWNPMGTLHGGVLCDLADAAMGFAFASTLEEGESFTTLELKINYLRPVRRARLTARARVVSRGRTVGLVECEVTEGEDRLIARATSTCMALRGEAAAGR